MSNSQHSVAIIAYPGCAQSAVQGLKEMFLLTNTICESINFDHFFTISILAINDLKNESRQFQTLILPPNISGDYFKKPDTLLLNWLTKQHKNGTTVCSICIAAFILAKTNLLQNKMVTTHWKYSSEFTQSFPSISLDTSQILINTGDVITAGGVMSWVDLGLELVAQFTNNNIMRQLGKILVVDTGKREQRYYQTFNPAFDHGDAIIITAQHYIQTHYAKALSISQLAKVCFLTDRTFLRHFVNATGYKPVQYLQNFRIKMACDLIENTNQTIDNISYQVGYQDVSAFRKVFITTVGLTPKAFKSRFVD